MKNSCDHSRGRGLRWLQAIWVLLTAAAVLRPFVRLAWEVVSYLRQRDELNRKNAAGPLETK